MDRPITPSPRQAAPAWAALTVVGGLAWLLTIEQAREMGTGPGTMGMAFLPFVGMWTAMMTAMMLPAIGPLAAAETLVAERSSGRVPGVLSFGAGFVVPWAAYGVLAFIALLGAGRLVEALPEAAEWLGVSILAVAGLYQFSPWKRRALAHCRAPMTSRKGLGYGANAAAGIRDGAFCVGCCWALTAVLVAVGVMNTPATVGLAAVVFAEKVLPRPRLIAAGAGAALLLLAVAAAIDPSMLIGLTAAEQDMGGL